MVMGAGHLVATLSQILLKICGKDTFMPLNVAVGLIVLLNLCCFIAGNVWVFGLWSTIDLEDELSEHYCDKTAYMFSFVSLIVMWVTGPILQKLVGCLPDNFDCSFG